MKLLAIRGDGSLSILSTNSSDFDNIVFGHNSSLLFTLKKRCNDAISCLIVPCACNTQDKSPCDCNKKVDTNARNDEKTHPSKDGQAFSLNSVRAG